MTSTKAHCDNECGTVLTENVHIFLVNKADEEKTFCEDCFMDIKKELKNEGWKGDNDEQAQKLMDDGMYSMFFF